MSAYKGAVLADSPLGYWPLDETSGTTAYDVSGNTRHGTYAGGPVQGVTGPFGMGKACTFDATDDIVSLGNSAWAQIGQPVTLEAWYYGTSSVDPQNLIVKGSAYGLYSRPTGSGLACYDWVANGWRTNGGSGYADSTWRHVVGVYVSNVATWYVNGVQNGATPTYTNPSNQSSSLYFGADHPTVQHMGGRLAHVAIYSTALSAARIAAHYSAAQREAVTY